MKLKDKVALLTGAGNGLRGTIAQAYAREGARLVLCDIDDAAMADTHAQVVAHGVACLALHCDVSDSSAVDAMFGQAVVQFGTIDVLVLIPASPRAPNHHQTRIRLRVNCARANEVSHVGASGQVSRIPARE